MSKSWIRVWVKTVHGGTAPGLARPGSRVSERISCGVPMAPVGDDPVRRGEVGGEPPVEADLELDAGALAAAIARSASARVIDIGFSQNTALPAAAHATMSSLWAFDEAVMTTASTSSAISSSASVYPCTERPQPGPRPPRVAGRRPRPAGLRHPPGDDLGVGRADPAGADEADPEWAQLQAVTDRS